MLYIYFQSCHCEWSKTGWISFKPYLLSHHYYLAILILKFAFISIVWKPWRILKQSFRLHWVKWMSESTNLCFCILTTVWQCSVTCGEGIQQRQVACKASDSTVTECEGEKPETVLICKLTPCLGEICSNVIRRWAVSSLKKYSIKQYKGEGIFSINFITKRAHQILNIIYWTLFNMFSVPCIQCTIFICIYCKVS